MDASLQVAEVRAGRGVRWLSEAFALFRRRPLAWIGLTTGWIVITITLLWLPILGGIVASLLQPAFFASFSIAAFKQAAGEPIGLNDLFAGFRRNMRSLVNVGAILLLAEFAIVLLMTLLGLPVGQFATQELLEALQGKEWIVALGLALTVMVKGALWFAPPLIAFHGMSTAHAVRWSVYAALSNFGAMLAYGIALTALLFLGSIPWALGLIVVMPVMVISTFVSYREVFAPE